MELEPNPALEAEPDHAVQDLKDKHEVLLSKMATDKDGLHYFKPDFDRAVFDPVGRKLQEDKRLDYLLRMENTIHEEYDNKGYVHPHGMTEYDYPSIALERRQGLETFKMRHRRENYIYLNLHPEIDALMSLFLQKLLRTLPSDPIRFAGEFFTLKGTTFEDFSKLLEEEKNKLKKQRGGGSSSKASKWPKWPPAGLRDVNEIQSLNLGPVCDPFNPTPEEQIEEIKPLSKPMTPELPKKKYYCGCKDPGRREFSHRKMEEPKVCEPEIRGEYEEEYEGEDWPAQFRQASILSEPDFDFEAYQEEMDAYATDRRKRLDDYGEKPSFKIGAGHYSIFHY